MNTNTDRNRIKEMQDRYGHLLDKYINAGSNPNPRLHKQTEEYIRDVENGRYGHLLDNVSNPLQKMYDSMMRLQDEAMEKAKRRKEEEAYSELLAKGRIEVEKLNEKRKADKVNEIKNGLMERKKAKLEAEARMRQEAQAEQDYLRNIDDLVRINPKLAEDVVGIIEKYK